MWRTASRGLAAVAGMATAVAMGSIQGLAADPIDAAWVALPEAELADERARGVVQNFEMTAELNGGTTQIDGAVMTNNIAGNAFAESAGIVNVIQNNGNQAIIQNGVVVNVNVYQNAAP